MKTLKLMPLLLGVVALSACNGGSSGSTTINSSFGQYTTNYFSGPSVSSSSSGSTICDANNNCTVTGNATLTLSFSLSGVTPSAYLTVESSISGAGISSSSSGSNCGSGVSANPSCTFTVNCNSSGTTSSGVFNFYLNGPSGQSTALTTPWTISCQ